MSESVDLQQLFRKWRAGDERSGHVMAQRFSDWYYAVSASRLGDREGRPPLERACRRFQEGITELTDPNKLTNWAHGILIEEIQGSGVRLAGGDQPNALTASRSPTELLKQASVHLNPDQQRLLVHAYDAGYSLDALTREAEAAGGYPMAVLHARYALKRALRDRVGIRLGEVPDSPKLDLAPLPLYEAGRMTSPEEELAFERWMLTDLTLCRDLAEFAAFALALRGGALELPRPAPAPTPTPPPVRPPVAHTPAPLERELPEEVEPSGGSMLPRIAIGVVVVAVLVIGLLFGLGVL
jgi:hypothetical protein